MAQCQGCKGDLTEENSPPSVVDRGRGMCNPCANKRMMSYRFKDRKRFILYSSRQGAKSRGIEHKLVLSDIPEIPKHCPVFPWLEIEQGVGEGIKSNSPSLDRIDNTRGYVKGNIRIISWRANSLKGNATDQELTALGNDATKRNKAK
jgi:hypothetical protein